MLNTTNMRSDIGLRLPYKGTETRGVLTLREKSIPKFSNGLSSVRFAWVVDKMAKT